LGDYLVHTSKLNCTAVFKLCLSVIMVFQKRTWDLTTSTNFSPVNQFQFWLKSFQQAYSKTIFYGIPDLWLRKRQVK